jgi:hypothetical protein
VSAGVEKAYDIQGTSPHPHTVTVSADNFAALANGESVDIDSTEGGHVHTVTLVCG